MEETSGPKTQGADTQQASCQQAHQESRKKRRSRRRRRRRQGHEGEGSHSTTRQQQVASQDNKKTSETTNATTVEAQYSTRKTSSSSTDSTTRDITDSCNIQTNLGETSTIPDQEIAPPSLQQHRQQGEIVVVTLQDKNNNIVDSTQTQFQSIQQTPNNPSDQLRVQAATTTTTLNQSSVNAVRVLFQDQHQQQQQLLLQQRTGSGTGGLYVDPGNRAEAGLEQQSSNIEHPGQTPVSASVIGLNRQLIERQLEAIQAADSERWNFDFRQSRPLRIEGHRYQVVQCPRPSCRTLNERSDPNTGIRLYQNNQQQQQHQERLPTGQGSDCKQTHRDKSDRGQDDARQ